MRMRGRDTNRRAGGEGERRVETAEEGQPCMEMKETVSPDADKIRFGDVKMEKLSISEV